MNSPNATIDRANLFFKHHIGGRNGAGGFPSIPKLNGSIASVFYEADSTCCPQIEKEQLSKGYAAVQVIPQCIGESRKPVQFNINYDPYTSSLLGRNPQYEDFYQDLGRFDYDYRSAVKTIRQVSLVTESLDNLPEKFPVDFLSLDTQGSEYQIIQGSELSLKTAVGIETEISFRQIYANSVLFGEICQFLKKINFEFICFTSITPDAPRSMPLHGRARKLHTFGDALFLRDPLGSDMNEMQKKKLIFAALAYGQLEYAAHCARVLGFTPAEGKMHGMAGSGEITSWIDLVDRFIEILSKLKHFQFPPRFSEIVSVEESFKRFELAEGKDALGNSSPVQFLRKLPSRLPQTVKRVLIKFINFQITMKYLFGGASDLEILFRSVGLSSISSSLKTARYRKIFPLRFPGIEL